METFNSCLFFSIEELVHESWAIHLLHFCLHLLLCIFKAEVLHSLVTVFLFKFTFIEEQHHWMKFAFWEMRKRNGGGAKFYLGEILSWVFNSFLFGFLSSLPTGVSLRDKWKKKKRKPASPDSANICWALSRYQILCEVLIGPWCPSTCVFYRVFRKRD